MRRAPSGAIATAAPHAIGRSAARPSHLPYWRPAVHSIDLFGMPELPEVCLYVNALDARITGRPIERVRLRSPSLLKTFDPPVSELVGKRVRAIGRIGKRIALHLDDDLHAVIHLMIAGRFQWRDVGAPLPGKRAAGALDFPNGTLVLTEASTKKRMSMWVVRGDEALRRLDPGGVEPLEVDFPGFQAALLRENRTLKRALTDPRILSGIGNAHSDEILLAARLSPVRLTRRLSTAELRRLYEATRVSLREWTERLQTEAGGEFPKEVTAFHPAMAAHGKFGKPCPRCGTPIQRIVYANRETNYCPECQTRGRLLADRALSRLLREDWPRTVEELEAIRTPHTA